MKRIAAVLIVAVLLATFLFRPSSSIRAQGFGGFGGAGNFGDSNGRRSFNDEGGSWTAEGQLMTLPPEAALNIITVEGTANLRVKPEEIRLVLAITSEAKTADECQTKNNAQTQAVLKSWDELKIRKDKIVTDFINVLPVYEWRVEERDGQQVRIQQRVGYRMQSNLHLSVKTEEEAMAAIHRAFQQGVTDIVTFDYWSSQLNQEKEKARAAAVKAAKKKAEVLLAVFDKPPKLVNIQESSKVFFPHSLYRTYENALEEQIEYNNRWRDMPAIKAYRPKMTFFHGLQGRSDVRPPTAAMHPEIAVVSTVRLYYQSPAEKAVVVRPGN